ncbi:MAG: hypothetical protein JJU00_04190 [Opitutales bacterium]|nr:hypothetical protein [Opitutales bacterium]
MSNLKPYNSICRGNSYLPLVFGLAALVIIGLLTILIFRPGPEGSKTAPATTDPEPSASAKMTDEETAEPTRTQRRITPGQEVTVEVMKTIFEGDFERPPPAIGDTVRLKEIFQVGTIYRKSGLTTISGRASHQDWGFAGFADFTMILSGVSEIFIEENNGKEITALVDITESAVVEFRAEPGIRMDLGRRFHDAFDLSASLLSALDGFMIPPGASRMTESAVNEFLKSPIANEIIQELDLKLISPPEIDALHQTRFRVHYRDGEGVRKVTFVGYLSDRKPAQDVENFVFLEDLHYLFQAGMFTDAHLFPDRPLRDGEIHNIYANVLSAPFPRSWQATVSGMLSFGRYDESGGRGEIYYRRGTLEVRGRPKGRTVTGTFIPSEGSIHFYSNPQRMDRLTLKGNASFTDRSAAHWIFEARHQVTPIFETIYKVRALEE